MKNSPWTINGKKLADSWNIETIDLLYIMFNHGLNVVDQRDDEVDIRDVLEDFKKNKDASEYMFVLSEVKDIETNLEVDGEIPYPETIRGKDLMARWDMHDAQISRIMFNTELAAIDPFGYELDSTRIFSLLNDSTLDVSNLLFRLSDIEDFETIYDELEPMLHVQDKDSDTDKIEPTPDSEQESIPIISFYKNGDKWLIGEKGKEKILNHLKGFDMISFLIMYEGKKIDVNVVYDLGKVSTEDYELDVANVPDGINILPQDALEMTYVEGDEKKYSLFNESVQKIVDGQTIEENENEIEFLKEKLLVEIDLEKKLHLKETINDIQNYIKRAKRSPRTISKFKDISKERARINVQKRIKTALYKISKIPKLNKILHKNSIKTGLTCCYKPDPSNPVKWILDPAD